MPAPHLRHSPIAPPTSVADTSSSVSCFSWERWGYTLCLTLRRPSSLAVLSVQLQAIAAQAADCSVPSTLSCTVTLPKPSPTIVPSPSAYTPPQKATPPSAEPHPAHPPRPRLVDRTQHLRLLSRLQPRRSPRQGGFSLTYSAAIQLIFRSFHPPHLPPRHRCGKGSYLLTIPISGWWLEKAI